MGELPVQHGCEAGLIDHEISEPKVTVHENRLAPNPEPGIREYDARRRTIHEFAQRDTDRWGEKPDYGWSDDKARQYAHPQRTDWGAFVRAKGFRLD